MDQASVSSALAQGYDFTISNGQVTGIYFVIGPFTVPVLIPWSITYSVGADSVTAIAGAFGGTETVVFTQEPAQANLYEVTSQTWTVTNPSTTNVNGGAFGYSFTISNGAVTAIQQTTSYDSFSTTFGVPIAPDTSFVAAGTTVTETSVLGNAINTTQYVQPVGSTLYAVASQSTVFVQPGAAKTLLSVDPYDRAEFTIGQDGAVTHVQSILADGTAMTVTPDSSTSFIQLAPGFVEKTVTYGPLSFYEVYHDGGSGPIYTAVAHGTGTAVDLVGLQAQLAQLPAGLEALV